MMAYEIWQMVTIICTSLGMLAWLGRISLEYWSARELRLLARVRKVLG